MKKNTKDTLYILFKDFTLGMSVATCSCKRCLERDEVEVVVHTINGEYKDYYTKEQLRNDSLYIAQSIQDIINHIVTINKFDVFMLKEEISGYKKLLNKEKEKK